LNLARNSDQRARLQRGENLKELRKEWTQLLNPIALRNENNYRER